jgi:hypothetical protein
MTESYQLPVAKILSAEFAEQVATVVVEIYRPDYLSYPVAPADLRNIDTQRSVFPFHQLVGHKEHELTFETYETPYTLPKVGGRYEFCSWWTPEAMDALRDLTAEWKPLAYPDNHDHDHCLFTYETISNYKGEKQGYSSDHGWITIQAYREFIEQDILRVRSNWRSIEAPVK